MTTPPEPDLPPRRLETRAILAGRQANGKSLATPLWATSTFEMDSVEESLRLATTPRVDAFYSRYGNPTVRAFENAVAEFEGAEAAQAFASGMGAVSSVVLALCSKGDHVVAQRQLFSSTSLLFLGVCPRFGIDVTFVDGTDSAAIAAAVVPGKTVMVFVETPANPVLQLVDLDAIGAIKGPLKVVDSTFAGPFIQRPLEHGADLVLHSATKSMAGHNDATLGVIAGANDLIEWIWNYHTIHGATASPVRRAERAAGHPHARDAGTPAERHRPAARRVPRAAPGGPLRQLPGSRQPPAAGAGQAPDGPRGRAPQLRRGRRLGGRPALRRGPASSPTSPRPSVGPRRSSPIRPR